MFVRAPYRLQVGAPHLQSSLDVTKHPETTLKPKHGLSPGKAESLHCYAE